MSVSTSFVGETYDQVKIQILNAATSIQAGSTVPHNVTNVNAAGTGDPAKTAEANKGKKETATKKAAAKEEKAATNGIDIAKDIMPPLGKLLAKDKNGKTTVARDLLKKYELQKIGQLKPEKYEAFLADVNAALGEGEGSGDDDNAFSLE